MDIKRSGGAISAGQNVQLWTAVDADAQRWMFYEVKPGQYKIVPKEGARYVLASYGSANGSGSGTSSTSAGNVYIAAYDLNNDNHLWEIADVQ